MLRLSRPFTLALLWLAIVLLPMRDWAAAAMPVAMAAQALPSAAAMPADAGEHASPMPCHDSGMSDSGDIGDSAAGSHAGCSHCDVCHAAAALLPGVAGPLPVLPAAHPQLDRPPGIERPVQSGPERPPRSQRA